MITPRRTRLVRVPDLQAFRCAIARLALDGDLSRRSVCAKADRLVIVPTRSAARQLQRTIEHDSSWRARGLDRPALVTRDQFYERLADRLSDLPRQLTPFEREAIVRSAAEEVVNDDTAPPFQLRPGLIAEIVRFYDQLKRQQQTVGRFEEILTDSLSSDVEDRGAERMLRQTRFLAAVFRSYERRLADAGLLDEHALRDRLLRNESSRPARAVVVTAADWISDADGLYRADFDLLTRLPALESLDVVATERMLESGFHQRVHDWLPGIEEVDARALDIPPERASPILLTPPQSTTPVFVNRDREEELIAIARHIHTSTPAEHGAVPDRIGVVFAKPLPYMYLARDVFGSAGIPYRTFDALPLAAEPFVAAVDLVLEFVASQFARSAIVALLRSPHFDLSESRFDPFAIAELDRALSVTRYLGELAQLRALAADWRGPDRAKAPLLAALVTAERLEPLLEPAPASVQIQRLLTFLSAHARPSDTDRERRVQTSVLGILEALGQAEAAHHDRPVSIVELGPAIRHWIEQETFVPETGARGVQLLDDRAAPFGDFDDLWVVGLIEGDWPQRPRRDVFYPPALLSALGWPSEHERRGADVAAFVDLVGSPRCHVALSTLTLDDEALVEPSSLIDEVSGAGLSTAEVHPAAGIRVLMEDMLSLDPPLLERLDETSREWAALRLSRTDASDARYHGQTDRRQPAALSVSAVESYLTCPFKFFAHHILRLDEEPIDAEVMDPRALGQFLHKVFESFYRTWQDGGHGSITYDNLAVAREVFSDVVERHVATLPEPEATLERTRLLGSSVAPGLGEIVLRMESERPGALVERLLEFPLDDEFEFQAADGRRRLRLRGTADRLDLLEDGTFRLIDYKLSSAPQKSRALQLPVYGLCAEQRLKGYRGRDWKLVEAAYIVFRGARRITPLFTARSDRDEVLAAAQEKLTAAVADIEAGMFPPAPDDVFICGFCSFGSVCRKDYVGDV